MSPTIDLHATDNPLARANSISFIRAEKKENERIFKIPTLYITNFMIKASISSIKSVEVYVEYDSMDSYVLSKVTGEFLNEYNYLTNQDYTASGYVSLKCLCPLPHLPHHTNKAIKVTLVDDCEEDECECADLIETVVKDKKRLLPYTRIIHQICDMCDEDCGFDICRTIPEESMVKDIIILSEEKRIGQANLMYEQSYRFWLGHTQLNKVLPLIIYGKEPRTPNYHIMPFQYSEDTTLTEALRFKGFNNVSIQLSDTTHRQRVHLFIRTECFT